MSDDRIGNVGRLAWLPSRLWGAVAFTVLWLVVGGVASIGAAKLTGVQKNDMDSWLPSDAESTVVLKEMAPFQDQNEIPAFLVYERPSGITPADVKAVAAQVTQIDDLDSVKRDVVPAPMSSDPQGGIIPSEDGQALLVSVPVDAGSGGWQELGDTVDAMKKIVDDQPAGLSVHITGPGGYAAQNAEAFSGIDGKLLFSAITIVVVILLFSYRSPFLWVLPVLSAGVALTVAQGVIYLLAKHADLTVNGQSQGILTVLVFGAGTDYALLLVARYREELRRHPSRFEAMAFALHRAGPAIFASGSTVVAGMLCLLLASLNSTKGMGPVCAIGIVVGLAVMLTLLPGLLVIFGRWIFWPVRPTYGSADHTETGLWSRIGRGIAGRPRAVWLTTVVALGVLALGWTQLDATGLKNSEQFYGKPDPVLGEEVLDAHFPAGAGAPVDVVSRADKADDVVAALADVDGVAQAGGQPMVAKPVVKGDLAWIAVTLSDGPDTKAARDSVGRVRAAIHGVDGADAKAGGNTAIWLDTMDAADRDNLVIIPVVLLVVLLILMALLRAVAAPLILIGTVVLSFAAALGLSGLIFKYVFDFAGADPGLPLFVFVFLVALGIDYNIFLMTRVHEEAKQVGTRRGALIGLAATGGVITSAGLVLAGTFAALGTLPMVAFAEIGIAVALGVLLDTIIVRAVLVTALNLDLGPRMWWPGRMSREDKDVVEPPEMAAAMAKD